MSYVRNLTGQNELQRTEEMHSNRIKVEQLDFCGAKCTQWYEIKAGADFFLAQTIDRSVTGLDWIRWL